MDYSNQTGNHTPPPAIVPLSEADLTRPPPRLPFSHAPPIVIMLNNNMQQAHAQPYAQGPWRAPWEGHQVPWQMGYGPSPRFGYSPYQPPFGPITQPGMAHQVPPPRFHHPAYAAVPQQVLPLPNMDRPNPPFPQEALSVQERVLPVQRLDRPALTATNNHECEVPPQHMVQPGTSTAPPLRFHHQPYPAIPQQVLALPNSERLNLPLPQEAPSVQEQVLPVVQSQESRTLKDVCNQKPEAHLPSVRKETAPQGDIAQPGSSTGLPWTLRSRSKTTHQRNEALQASSSDDDHTQRLSASAQLALKYERANQKQTRKSSSEEGSDAEKYQEVVKKTKSKLKHRKPKTPSNSGTDEDSGFHHDIKLGKEKKKKRAPSNTGTDEDSDHDILKPRLVVNSRSSKDQQEDKHKKKNAKVKQTPSPSSSGTDDSDFENLKPRLVVNSRTRKDHQEDKLKTKNTKVKRPASPSSSGSEGQGDTEELKSVLMADDRVKGERKGKQQSNTKLSLKKVKQHEQEEDFIKSRREKNNADLLAVLNGQQKKASSKKKKRKADNEGSEDEDNPKEREDQGPIFSVPPSDIIEVSSDSDNEAMSPIDNPRKAKAEAEADAPSNFEFGFDDDVMDRSDDLDNYDCPVCFTKWDEGDFVGIMEPCGCRAACYHFAVGHADNFQKCPKCVRPCIGPDAVRSVPFL